MTDTTLTTPARRAVLRHLWQDQRVWLASVAILAGLAVFDPAQATESALFAGSALLNTAPFLVLSITIAACPIASESSPPISGADGLVTDSAR